MLPVTLTVILGPLIAIGYQMTQPMDAAKGSFSLAQAPRGPLCLLMFVSLFVSWGLRPLRHAFIRPLLLLATCAVLTSFVGPYPYQHLVFAVKMAFIMAVFASALHLAQEGLVGERWLSACAWAILLVMAACIGMGLITGSTVGVYRTRYATAALMNHVSVASVFILSTLPVFIRCLAVGRRALAGLAIFYASLFFTMRRSALIAAAGATCGSLLLYLNRRQGRVPWRRILASAGIFLLLAGIHMSTPAGADLMARFKELSPYGGTGSGRYVFWRISADHIVHRPVHAQLLGEGIGCIRDVLREHYGLSIGSHNDGLDLVHALGAFGLIGIVWWYLELARLAWRLRGHRNGPFQGACATVIVLGLTSVGTGGAFEPPWALCYAALGLWVGQAASARQPCFHDVGESVQED